jgi:hypothetical protein
MVTRKAIVNAFEIITNTDIKSVTVFCSAKNIPLSKTCRVRVTRDKKSPDSYRVTLGRMNYAERQYVMDGGFKAPNKLPKLLIAWKPGKKPKGD